MKFCRFCKKVHRDGVWRGGIIKDAEESICDKCSKGQGQYFEGILQIRNPNQQTIDEIKIYLASAERKSIFCTKQKKVRNGFDFYLTDKRAVSALAKSLAEKLGGTYKTSAKLFSQSRLTSKKIYRVNACYTPAEFTIGEIILVNDFPVKVTAMGRQIKGLNLKNNQKIAFKTPEKIIKLKTFVTRVIKVKPSPEALNMTNYQPEVILNPSKDVKNGEKVKLVYHKGLYMIPKKTKK